MIPEGTPIEPGLIVSNDIFGGRYKVLDIPRDTDDIEVTGHLNGNSRIYYEQLYQGDFPPGTRWDKDPAKFRLYFTVVEDVSTNTETSAEEAVK
jgi:hypothetical protein